MKVSLLIIITLLLGFTLGILTSAQLRHKRMRPVRMYASENYFREHLYRLIEPSEDQRKQLDDIIDNYGQEFRNINDDLRRDIDELMDDQWKEIKPILNRDQIDKLEEMDKNRRKAMKEFRDRKDDDGPRRYGRGRSEWDKADRHRSRGDSLKHRNDSLDSLNPQDQKTDNQ